MRSSVASPAPFRAIWRGLLFASMLAVSTLPLGHRLVAQDSEKLGALFPLDSIHGTKIERASRDRVSVVVFLGTECPLVKLYVPRLEKLKQSFGDKVSWVAIASNHQDSVNELKQFATQVGLTIPIHKDRDTVVADRFAAARTPEVFLLGPNGNVVYQGAIDDQYSPGVARANAKRHYLKRAIESALAGQPIKDRKTTAEGCIIGRAPATTASTKLTFANDIAPILIKNGVECHRPGAIGPMELIDYDEVVGWGEMLVEVIDDGRMPPWHATNTHAEIANQRSMQESEKALVREWVAGGMPMGDQAKLPKVPKYPTGWRLPREPDRVIEMRDKPFQVPAEGTVEYQYFVVDPNFKEDQWISAAEVIPGNPSVVHHSIVFIRPPDGSTFRGVGWLGAYVPGQSAPANKRGYAIKVPANSKLVFQQHYTPNGTAQSDISKIGLVFADASSVTHEVYTLAGLDQDFEIQPNEEQHDVHVRLNGYPKNGTLLSVAPHMHFRGKSFDLWATSDAQQQLIEVPRYDFNWQHSYVFSTPIDLSSIQSLEMKMSFDNSVKNPFNPDPKKHVSWGDQTWEEMAVTFFTVAQPILESGPSQTTTEQTTVENTATPTTPATGTAKQMFEQEVLAQFKEKTDRILKRFDKNLDGQLSHSEVPNAIKHFKFGRIDINGDELLSRLELALAFHDQDQP